MEFEPWLLLILPVLFAAGWWTRGYDARVRAADPGAVPRSMFRGLNLLLNEQPDRAIDAFIEVARLDPETIELHLALGSLFRRRGEFDRAIRIHNYLLSRADLPRRGRSLALGELGQDFLKGGMLDRAEEAFVRLREDPEHRFEALRALLRIYQTGRDWTRAIDCTRRLEREAGESHPVELSHYYCELAEQALRVDDLETAAARLADAATAHRKSVRAAILSGHLAMRRGQPDEAIAAWRRVESERPEYLALVAEPLTAAMDAAGGRAEALNLLRRNLLDHPSLDLLDVTARRVAEWEGRAAAENLLREELKRRPSLVAFERLLGLRQSEPASGPRTLGRVTATEEHELEALRGVLQAQTRRLVRYRCGRCGFRARDYHWLCPGCAGWETYPPEKQEIYGE